MNVRQQYDMELQALSSELIRMGDQATDAIALAMDALRQNDKTLARQVMDGDEHINAMEKDIEQRCLRLLLKQQPVAGDLRKISTAIKMITDIERIGDAAADIAEISLHRPAPAGETLMGRVLRMAADARDMVAAAIRSYVDEDLILAQQTRERDDVVDAHFLQIRDYLASELGGEQPDMDELIDYLMIVKYLERVGDHAVNICEWVEFYMTGIYKNERIV